MKDIFQEKFIVLNGKYYNIEQRHKIICWMLGANIFLENF